MVKIVEGNLFDSEANIICHQCNCQGIMSSGVALEVKTRYPNVYNSYRRDYEEGRLELGYVNFSTSNQNQVIANMCGQNNFGYDGGIYTHYDKLQECLDEVVRFAITEFDRSPKIAFPYLMSCHRGGGDWNVVYNMIEKTFDLFDVEIWKL